MITRIQHLKDAHRSLFESGYGEMRMFRAPGRVNLIGEHTDYNDGFVFPIAIDRDVILIATPRTDQKVNIHSLDFNTSIEFDLKDMDRKPEEAWGIYPFGVAAVLSENTHNLCGVDVVLDSTVPIGAGLSSSAALETALAVMWTTISDRNIDGPSLARLCQRAENEYAGVQCGIMDQFISCLAEPGAALLIDCRSLSYQSVPIAAPEYKLVITNTNKPRELADSAYNERRNQCEQGVEILKEHIQGVHALRDVTPEQFSQVAYYLPEVVRDRCNHVISENRRVLDSVKALEDNDLIRFGELMNESHDSLRDFYDVSCNELDLLVDIARGCQGVSGSRMTGGGFGGCTVSLVEAESVKQLKDMILSEYPDQTGYQPDFYICEPSAGAGEIAHE